MTNLRHLEHLRLKAKVPVWIVAAQFGVGPSAYSDWLRNRTGMHKKYLPVADSVEQRLELLLANGTLPILCHGVRMEDRHERMKQMLAP